MTKTELLKIAKPILFNTEMTRAILDGRKTVTRRVIKPQPIYRPEHPTHKVRFPKADKRASSYNLFDWESFVERFAKYQVGDILYVRETWNFVYDMDDNDQPDGEGRHIYQADDPMPFSHWVDPDTGEHKEQMPWKPSIHMPKEAARIFLRVKSVRVERLRDIDVSNCVREGVTWENYPVAWTVDAKPAFIKLWNSTIKPADLPLYGWEANPWVWVYEFERISPQ